MDPEIGLSWNANICPRCIILNTEKICFECGKEVNFAGEELLKLAITQVVKNSITNKGWPSNTLKILAENNIRDFIKSCPNKGEEFEKIKEEIETEVEKLLEETRKEIPEEIKNLNLDDEIIAIITIFAHWLKKKDSFLKWQNLIEIKPLSATSLKRGLGQQYHLDSSSHIEAKTKGDGDQFCYSYYIEEITILEQKIGIVSVRDEQHIPNSEIYILIPEIE